MANKGEIKFPTICTNFIQGAYGRRGKEKIVEHQNELVNKVKEIENDPKKNRAKRLRWDNLNRQK
jgi:hypothetical protein